jgi:hypothetical protein
VPATLVATALLPRNYKKWGVRWEVSPSLCRFASYVAPSTGGQAPVTPLSRVKGPVPRWRKAVPCGGPCPPAAGPGPHKPEAVPADRQGPFPRSSGYFSPQIAPARPFLPPVYQPKCPFSPSLYPLTAKTRPFCRPQPYPTDRPFPQPSLDGIAEAVCITTPFALYYDS